MLKLGRFTKVRVLFQVLVFVFNFDLFKFSAAILEKGLLNSSHRLSLIGFDRVRFLNVHVSDVHVHVHLHLHLHVGPGWLIGTVCKTVCKKLLGRSNYFCH